MMGTIKNIGEFLKRPAIVFLIASNMVAWPSAHQPAEAQSQTWKIEARARAQRLASAAQNHLNKGETDAAIALLIEANRTDSTDPLPLSLLGLALNIKGRYQEALDTLRKAYQLDSKARETILSVGFTNYLAHQYDQSIDVWHRLLKMHPDIHAAHADIGFACLRKGDFSSAESNFRGALKHNPNSQLAYEGMATLQYLNGNLVAARHSAEQAQAIRPHPQVLILLANIDFLEGKLKSAQTRLAEYKTLIKKPNSTRPMTAFGFLPQHDFKWDPFDVDNYDAPAFIEARMLDQSRKSDSKRSSLIKSSNLDAVLSKAESNLSTAPDDYYLLYQIGILQLAKGDFAKATEALSKVAAHCPECHVSLLYLALALDRMNQADEAKSAVEGYKETFANQPLNPVFSDITERKKLSVQGDSKDGKGDSKDGTGDNTYDKGAGENAKGTPATVKGGPNAGADKKGSDAGF